MSFFIIWLTEKLPPKSVVSILASLFSVEEKLIGNVFSFSECTCDINFERRFLGKPSKLSDTNSEMYFTYELCIFPHSASAKSRYNNNLEFSLAFSGASGLPLSISGESFDAYQYLLVKERSIYVAKAVTDSNIDKACFFLIEDDAMLLSSAKIVNAWRIAHQKQSDYASCLMGEANWWLDLV